MRSDIKEVVNRSDIVAFFFGYHHDLEIVLSEDTIPANAQNIRVVKLAAKVKVVGGRANKKISFADLNLAEQPFEFNQKETCAAPGGFHPTSITCANGVAAKQGTLKPGS